MFKQILTFLLINLFILNGYGATKNNKEELLSPEVISRTKRGVVSVNNNIIKAAHNHVYPRKATAFLIDKKRGIFLTNAHVANNSFINNITLTTFNGREIDAKFLYSDPHKDFAFLRADSKDTPQDLVELKIIDKDLKTYEKVFLISNNEGKDFSIQTGNIVSQYSSIGFFPQQAITISLNTRGGSSGSPVLDYQGNVVALNFAGHSTYADALKISYITEALKYIKQNSVPKRKSLGIHVGYKSLDKAKKYQNFPAKTIKKYVANYPDALNKSLVITGMPNDSSSRGKLKVGDIIWQVNGEDIGPNMFKFDKLINESKNELEITVYRSGVKLSIPLIAKDLSLHAIKDMLIFGGATFYEVNEFIHMLTGAPLGSLFISNIEQSSIFDNLPPIYGFSNNYSALSGLYMIKVQSIDGNKISSLKELKKIIPQLLKKKFFTINYKNYFFNFGMDSVAVNNRSENYSEVEYVNFGSKPVSIHFDQNSLDWKQKDII